MARTKQWETGNTDKSILNYLNSLLHKYYAYVYSDL